MTRLRSALLGVAIFAGTATVAAAQSTAPATQPPTAGQRAGRGERGERQQGMHDGKHRRGGRGARALFRGVQLTNAQKQQVKAIHARYKPQLEALRESMKPALQDARAARQKGDTAAAKAAFARTAGDRAKARAILEQEAKDVRAILTPEQQGKFDQNVARMRDRASKREARLNKKA